MVTRDENSRDCPDAEALAAQVRAIVGRPVLQVETESASTWVQVEITRGFDSYRATIHTRGQKSGSREITDVGPGCGNLGDALAVALAVLLDSGAPDAVKVPAEARVSAPPAPSVPTQTQTPPPRAATWGGELGVGVSLAVLEHASPFASGAVRWVFERRFALALGFAYFLPDRVEREDGFVELRLMTGELRGCAAALRSRDAALHLCFQSAAGSLSGSGHNFDQNASEALPWVSLGAGLEVQGTISPEFAWTVRGLALAPLIRQGFKVENNGEPIEVFVTPRVGALFTVALRFGS